MERGSIGSLTASPYKEAGGELLLVYPCGTFAVGLPLLPRPVSKCPWAYRVHCSVAFLFVLFLLPIQLKPRHKKKRGPQAQSGFYRG